MTRARDLAAFVSNADGDIKFDTDTLFIDSSANRVAIGNTAPSRPLHITANPAMILLEDSDGGSDDKKAQIQVDSGAFEVNARNDDDSSRTDNILVADLGNGNVGIGTNSPDRVFHVSRSSASVISGKFESASTSGSQIVFKDADTTTNDLQVRIGSDANDLVHYAGGSERMRLLSGGGLTFNGDTAAANALDDYEEGTFTPVFNSVTAPTFTTQDGKYTKIGNVVNCTVEINVASGLDTSDGSGVTIGGLPFTAQNGEETALAALGRYTTLLSGRQTLVRNFRLTSTSILLLEGSNDNIQYSNCATSGILQMAFTYRSTA